METLFIGKSTIFLPETESTNSYAHELLKNVNPPEGTMVYTTRQTRGRGQRGSIWHSERDANLAASFILKPDFLQLSEHFALYQIAALACRATIAGLLGASYAVKIKWPNDILVNGKKISGILIENGVQGNTLRHAVIGIGINLNQTKFDESWAATSTKLLQGIDANVKTVVELLCLQLEKYYVMLRQRKQVQVSEEYSEHMFGLGERRLFEHAGQTKRLLIRGLGKHGLLQLADESGELLEVDVKEVRWVYAAKGALN